jgi:hypothetical protein
MSPDRSTWKRREREAAMKEKFRTEHVVIIASGTKTRSYPAWIPRALDLIARLANSSKPPSCYALDEARVEIVNSQISTMPLVSAVEQDGETMVRIHWPKRRTLIIGDRYCQTS